MKVENIFVAIKIDSYFAIYNDWTKSWSVIKISLAGSRAHT